MASVASISAQEPVSRLIADAFDRVGKDGVITVEESNTMASSWSYRGHAVHKGYICLLRDDTERMEAVSRP